MPVCEVGAEVGPVLVLELGLAGWGRSGVVSLAREGVVVGIAAPICEVGAEVGPVLVPGLGPTDCAVGSLG